MKKMIKTPVLGETPRSKKDYFFKREGKFGEIGGIFHPRIFPKIMGENLFMGKNQKSGPFTFPCIFPGPQKFL